MNKEELAAEFVCLLDINSRPQDVAQLKKLIEQFFSYGAARIDLIGKVMDLDNEIHGLNLDIPLLEETKHSIETLSTTGEFYAHFIIRLQVGDFYYIITDQKYPGFTPNTHFCDGHKLQ